LDRADLHRLLQHCEHLFEPGTGRRSAARRCGLRGGGSFPFRAHERPYVRFARLMKETLYVLCPFCEVLVSRSCPSAHRPHSTTRRPPEGTARRPTGGNGPADSDEAAQQPRCRPRRPRRPHAAPHPAARSVRCATTAAITISTVPMPLVSSTPESKASRAESSSGPATAAGRSRATAAAPPRVSEAAAPWASVSSPGSCRWVR